MFFTVVVGERRCPGGLVFFICIRMISRSNSYRLYKYVPGNFVLPQKKSHVHAGRTTRRMLRRYMNIHIPSLSHQQKLDLCGSEVARVDLNDDVLRVPLDVPVLLHTLAHPRDFRVDILEGLKGRKTKEASANT